MYLRHSRQTGSTKLHGSAQLTAQLAVFAACGASPLILPSFSRMKLPRSFLRWQHQETHSKLVWAFIQIHSEFNAMKKSSGSLPAWQILAFFL